MHILASVAVLLPGQWGTESLINKNESRFHQPTRQPGHSEALIASIPLQS